MEVNLQFTEIVQSIATGLLTHRSLVFLTAAVAGLIFAVVMLLPRRGVLSTERWATFVGWAFLLYSFLYGIQLARWVLTDTGTVQLATELHIIIDLLILVCLTFKNLCFFAAARILLNRSPALPKWAWILAVISSSIVAWDNSHLIARLPDSVFSALCLSMFAYAAASNLRFNVKRLYSTLALIAGSLFVVVNLCYVLNPLIAKSNLLDVGAFITGPASYIDKQQALDLFIFSVALPLNFGLFLPAYVLLTSLMTASFNLREVLAEITHRRQDYLSSQGIVRTIGMNLEADLVELYIRLPSNSAPRVSRLWWSSNLADEHGSEVRSLTDNRDTLLDQVLIGGKEFFFPSINGHFRRADNTTKGIEAKALIMSPVILHGAVVGCLRVELHGVGRFNYAALQIVRNMSSLLAPSVQDYRELAALDQLNYRFAKLQVGMPTLSLKEANHRIVGILDDVLSPMAIGLFVEIGFESIKGTIAKTESLNKLLEDYGITYYWFQDEMTPIHAEGLGELLSLRTQLIITTRPEESDPYTLGELRIIIPADKDEVGHPTLISSSLHLRAVASLVTDALLDLARDYFSALLRDFSIRLSKIELNIERWFIEIETTIRQAGLLWVVATKGDEDGLLGPENATEILRDLPADSAEVLERGDFNCIVFHHPATETYHVIRLYLRESGQSLWIGVGRNAFGVELNFASPWKVFLEQLAEVADNAMASLIATKELTHLQIEAAQYQGLATVAVTTGTLVHQIVNLAKEQLNPSTSLLEAIKGGRIQVNGRYEELVRAIKNSAEQLFNLTQAVTNVTRLDDHRPCSLREAVLHAKNLFETSISQRGIKLEIHVPDNISIDVPYHVAALALANLIGNAKDAVGKDGIIRIDVVDAEDMFLCYVSDNGPGVPEEFRGRIFDLGFSTKSQGSGWGLYLSSRSLLESGGDIELVSSDAGSTTFRIRFPKVRQEKQHVQ